jgi:hypothetical protein
LGSTSRYNNLDLKSPGEKRFSPGGGELEQTDQLRLTLRRADLIGAATAEIDRTEAKVVLSGEMRGIDLVIGWAMVLLRPLSPLNLAAGRFREPWPIFAETSSSLHGRGRQVLLDQKKFPKGRFVNLLKPAWGTAGFSLPRPKRGTPRRAAPIRVQLAVPVHPACPDLL